MSEMNKANELLEAINNGYEVIVASDKDMREIAASHGKERINHVIIHDKQVVILDTDLYHSIVKSRVITLH